METKKLAGQNPQHILKTLREMFNEDGGLAPLNMKNHLATTFFKMVINDEQIEDKLRNMARSYLQLYEFLSTFDESAGDLKQ